MSLSFIYPGYLWLLLFVPLVIALSLPVQYKAVKLRSWASVVLRICVLLGLIFALAGAQLRIPSNQLSTVFILDMSDSIPDNERSRGEEIIREAISGLPSGDRAAIILFGENALVERFSTNDSIVTNFASVPISTRTNITGALELAQAILPDEGSKRLILFTDGLENVGQAIEQGRIAASNNIQILYSPLGNPNDTTEVLFESLEAPANAHIGEELLLVATIHSSAAVDAKLRLFYDNNLFLTQDILLNPGLNSYQFNIPTEINEEDDSSSKIFRRFKAQIIPEADGWLQNNEAYAFTFVHGPPKILVVEGNPGEGTNLIAALRIANINVESIPPEDLFTELANLVEYQAVVLINVPENSLPPGSMETLVVYVRDLGMGLLMVGGDQTLGAGGYLRTPLEEILPVSMDVKDKELQANLALVLAVDKSGSMGRCHCDDPNLNQSYSRSEVGQPKVDIAKEAIMRASSALGEQDFLGVVAFDDNANWALQVEQLPNPSAIEQAIGKFQAEGSTNLQAGLQAAYSALQNVPARRKHIILMTDGWVRQGEFTPLIDEMKNQGITLSVIAAGSGSAEYLFALAENGGGRYYPASDILSVPDIFLKETIQSVGQYIIEIPFYPIPSAPSPILRGLDPTSFPPLLGYNGTTFKNIARKDLLTSRGDPLLASWQYGLGRAAVWTSDFKGQWATEFISWQDFPKFVSQLIGWILPAPKAEGIEATVELGDGQALITVSALDDGGKPLNQSSGTATIVSQDLETIDIPIQQVGAGQYLATGKVSKPGTYLVRVGLSKEDQSLGQQLLGLVVPFSPEYKFSGTDRSILVQLADATGGEELIDPQSAFLHTLPASPSVKEIWKSLLLFTIFLFPLDIALRRLALEKADFQNIRLWFSQRIWRKPSEPVDQPKFFERLFQARQRVRTEQFHVEKLAEDNKKPVSQTIDQPDLVSEASKDFKPSTQPKINESLTRLKEAKKRARKKQ